jgi:hypothetical protein
MLYLQIVVSQMSPLQLTSVENRVDSVLQNVHTNDRNTIAWASPGRIFWSSLHNSVKSCIIFLYV